MARLSYWMGGHHGHGRNGGMAGLPPGSASELVDCCLTGSLLLQINCLIDYMGKVKILTIYKIKIPERIEMKFGAADYVHEINPKPNFVAVGSAGAFGGVCEIYGFVTLFFLPAFWDQIPKQFSRKMAYPKPWPSVPRARPKPWIQGQG